MALTESDVHEPVNLGNPDEMSLIEMAKLVVELSGSSSEIVYEALPVDDPQVRQPDITRARDLLGWEPHVDVREGLMQHDRALRHRAGRGSRAVSSPEAKNLEVISKAIDQHNTSCDWPAVAIEMNPFEVERLGWDEIRGLPIRPNPDLGTGSFRVVCAREQGELPGEEVEAVAEQPAPSVPVEVPEPAIR